MTLALSSVEKLHFDIENPNKTAKSKKILDILSVFNKNEAEGLFLLANSTADDSWNASLFFLKDFASVYVKTLCHQNKQRQSNILPLPITNKELAELANKAPIIADTLFFDSKKLQSLWQAMNDYATSASKIQSIDNFIATYLPNWQKVGRICFHLVENKQDEQYPFAFMPTVISHLNNQANLIYLPLKLAISKINSLDLLSFLHPLYNLAQKLNWLKQSLSSKEIYQASYWTVKQAYSLLKDAEEIKNNGIIVILPDWWKKNNQPRLKFSIGNQTKSTLDLQTMLNCDANIVHNDKPLTDSEIAMLLQAENNLVPLRGSWVEADAENLKTVLEQWNKLKKSSATGISFIEGMRLLSGLNKNFANDHNNQFNADDENNWSSYVAGPWLNDTLHKLRDPSLLQNLTPEKLTASKLRHYQQLGVNWLYFLTNLGLGACLADDMGLGKSIQIIALLLLAKQSSTTTKKCSLLILPASLLSNWKNELNKFAPSLTTCFLHPSQSTVNEIAEISANPNKLQHYDLVLTTYATLWRQTWLLDQSWDKVILDEAQAIKNPTSKQTCAIKNLKSNVRIALTGTPIENSLTDLWSLFDFLLPGLLGSYNNFKKIINKIEKTAEEQQQTSNYSAISSLIQPYILRRLKTDKKIITDLPEKTEVNAYCGLTNLQARLYKKTIKELTTALDYTEISAIKRKGLVLNYLLKFKQICNHPAQLLATGDYSPTQSGKFARLKELCSEIKQKQEKVLIFTQFKTITKPLAVFLETIFGVPGLILHGTTPIKKRQEIVSAFQEKSGPPFMVLSLKAGGTGLNLTAANHVIHFDRWWNPAVENQATDRVFRIGQKSNVLVHKFVCSGTIEDNINSLINQKTKLANVILASDVKAPKLTELTNQEILQLVALDLNKIQI
jgi:non-specific serine/threonine protein kinase